jgi:hypothetical protein
MSVMARHNQVKVCAIFVLAALIVAYAGERKPQTPSSGGKATVYLRGVPNSASITINDDPTESLLRDDTDGQILFRWGGRG